MTINKENTLRIALVKQEVYQDLYVCSPDEKDPAAILFSSMGRVGPFGLIADLGGDFYIVKEEPEKETQLYRNVIPKIAGDLQLLKTRPLNELPGQHFKQPGSDKPNGYFAVSCYEVDWGKYDVVVSLNISLPTSLVRKFPDTLFAYMIGEANLASRRASFGYDVCMNQMARGHTAIRKGVIDFPYTFLTGNTLESLMQEALGRQGIKSGIYAEINCSTERPVRNIPEQLLPVSEATGHPIILHKQNIRDNLEAVYDSKYFVKIGGRRIRGNSVIEAISLGSLVLMDPEEVIHRELFPQSTVIRTADEAVERIRELDQDPAAYQDLRKAQKDLLNEYIFHKPLESLKNALHKKRNLSPLTRPFYYLYRSF